VTTSTFNIRKQTRRIVLPCVVAAALMAPAATWAMQGAPIGATEETPAPATRPDLPPADPSDVAESVATLPDLAPANPMDVGQSVSDLAPASPTDIGRPGAPITLLPDQTRLSPKRIFQSPEPSTLPDLAPANPTQITSEAIPAPATLPDLAPANPMPVAAVGQTAGDDGFDFGDAGIGVAIVAGACALLLAAAAFFVGRRRRLGASHS
jgi:hypothetical protein